MPSTGTQRAEKLLAKHIKRSRRAALGFFGKDLKGDNSTSKHVAGLTLGPADNRRRRRAMFSPDTRGRGGKSRYPGAGHSIIKQRGMTDNKGVLIFSSVKMKNGRKRYLPAVLYPNNHPKRQYLINTRRIEAMERARTRKRRFVAPVPRASHQVRRRRDLQDAIAAAQR
jgi:hypothetical protein